MNELPRRTLCELVARHGKSVAREPRRVEGLLRDYCGAHRREISALVTAMEERVASDLLALRPGQPREALLSRLARRLHDNVAMDEDAARWAVNSWALALGVVSSEELKGLEQQKSKALPMPSPIATPSKSIAATVARTSSMIVVSAAGDGDYATISEALSAATPAARVLVRPGLYSESLIISRKVELVGEGERQDIIVESRAGSCLLMRTDEALVRGLTLRGLAGASNTRPGYFAVDIPQGRLTIEECDITSNSLSCIGIHNDTTRPLIARCVIHSSADSGIYFFNAAAGEVLECDVHHNANVGVAVTDGASAFVNRCSIHEGADAGVVAWDGGTCTIEASEIYGNAKAGVGTSDRGHTLIKNSRLYGGENSGVFVHNKGQSILESCDIFGHHAGEVAATLNGSVVLRDCKLHHGRMSGVITRDEGRATLERCEVFVNADAGINVQAGGAVIIQECLINRNARVGLRVAEGGAASVTASDLTGNLLGAWDVADGALVEESNNNF